MRLSAQRIRQVATWLGAACLGFVPVLPLSAQPPVLRKTLGVIHTDAILSVAFSHDGKAMAAGSADHTVTLWDVAQARNPLILKGHPWHVNSVAFSPNGKTLASGGDNTAIRLWDVATGKNTAALGDRDQTVLSLASLQVMLNKIDGRSSGAWGYARAGVFDLRGHIWSGLDVATEVEEAEKLLLLGAQRREGASGLRMMLPLFLGVDHQCLANAA